MTTVYHLTNEETNFTFRIAAGTATVITLAANSWAQPKVQELTVEAARTLYGQALKFGCRKGFTRHQPLRKITTDAQYAAWAAQAFDFDANDNDAEAELAMHETFVGQGYLEVAA
jgi:hypothetical protein